MEPYHEEQLRVRYQETDQMGVVHHSQYAVWFEVGRTGLIRRLGISYGELEEKGMLLPVVDLSCRFVAPARFDDVVGVRTQVREMRGSKLTFAYEVVRLSDGGILARGQTIHLWVNPDMKSFNFERTQPQWCSRLRAFTCKSEQGE
ncbi:acyl-CoA thioesterase [Desmospora profundinema]|uniref:Acyl-CoA thioester hydrolase n=1 Tax=Desmospora profundinema TaxID=1571184 RepID=A0ABU1IPA5_9BACL|nr:thioesterase family protein [Desmospora profundinema]MDR6226621.1 acyl-CoA thioester hydrolase [Desmospora profundinema]